MRHAPSRLPTRISWHSSIAISAVGASHYSRSILQYSQRSHCRSIVRESVLQIAETSIEQVNNANWNKSNSRGSCSRRSRRTFLAGVVFAGPYHASGDPSTSPYTYGRFNNPTWTRFEQALSELEGGPAVSFGSGIA